MGRKSREKLARRLAKVTPLAWTPFERAYLSDEDLARFGLTKQPEIYKNSRYQVNVRRLEPKSDSPPLVHLSIKRLDKEPIHDWRELQRIKNEIVGPEFEAVELYPAEERLVDDANQFHLWVFHDSTFRLPFGFTERLVSEGGAFGSKQRPFPSDAKPSGLRVVDEEKERLLRLKEM